MGDGLYLGRQVDPGSGDLGARLELDPADLLTHGLVTYTISKKRHIYAMGPNITVMPIGDQLQIQLAGEPCAQKLAAPSCTIFVTQQSVSGLVTTVGQSR